jgi:M6 family metalloprotease-like protein
VLYEFSNQRMQLHYGAADIPGDRAGAVRAGFEALFFGPGDPGDKHIAGYFSENSGGAFTWSKAAVLGPFIYPNDPRTSVDESRWECAFDQRDDTDGDGRPDRQRCPGTTSTLEKVHARVLQWAGKPAAEGGGGFNFKDYDRDRNEQVSGDELGIALIRAIPGSWGQNQTMDPGCLDVGSPAVTVCRRNSAPGDAIVALQEGAGFATIAHELAHLLGAIDLYGADIRLSSNATLMGGTVGAVDDPATYHFDPWHKIQLGWAKPRAYALGLSPATSTALFEPPSSAGAYEPVILYDARASRTPTFEYLILEHRNRTASGYDADAADRGVAIWYVQTDANKQLRLVAARINAGGNNVLDTRTRLDDVLVGSEIQVGRNDRLDTPGLAMISSSGIGATGSSARRPITPPVGTLASGGRAPSGGGSTGSSRSRSTGRMPMGGRARSPRC